LARDDIDELRDGEGGFIQQQESLDIRLITGDIDLEKYKDETRAIQIERAAREDQIYAQSDIDFDSLPPTDPRSKPIRAAKNAYWEVDIEDYTNDVTLEIDFDGFKAARLEALEDFGLTEVQIESILEDFDANKTDVQIAEDEAREFVDEEEPKKYDNLSQERGEELDDFRAQVRTISADAGEAVGSQVQQENIAVALAEALDDPDLARLYKEVEADFDEMLNRAWIRFWTENRDREFRNIGLDIFFPWRYDSQADLVRFGALEERPRTGGTDRPERPARPERPERPTRLTELARDEEEVASILDALNSGKIPISAP
jgi:hypothetical protein